MNIIVLIKQVPDTMDVKIDSKTGSLIREGMEGIVNPDDLNALEAAISLREEKVGKVMALSMGPPRAIEALSVAIGMGADEAFLLSDGAFAGADTWATSSTLGKAIEKIGAYDLILCGRQAIDGDTAQVGPQVAAYLNIPQVTYVFEVEAITKKSIVVKRRLEDGYERIKCNLPALLTVIGELNKPRYPQIDRLIAACEEEAPIRIWNAADIGVQTRDTGLEGSMTHVIKTFAPKFKRKGEMIEGDTERVVMKLVGKFREIKLT